MSADKQQKPFKGVISDWYRDGKVILGRCLWHREMFDQVTAQAIMQDAPVRYQEIHTSAVEKVSDRGTFAICETRNSYYVLINPRESASANTKTEG